MPDIEINASLTRMLDTNGKVVGNLPDFPNASGNNCKIAERHDYVAVRCCPLTRISNRAGECPLRTTLRPLGEPSQNSGGQFVAIGVGDRPQVALGPALDLCNEAPSVRANSGDYGSMS